MGKRISRRHFLELSSAATLAAGAKESPSLTGIYVNTVNCLPVCRALCAQGLCGNIKLITTDLFADMVAYFEKGTIRASIHGRPFIQGEISTRLLVDHLVNGRPLPSAHYVAPHIVLRSNLFLFREIRQVGEKASLLPRAADILR